MPEPGLATHAISPATLRADLAASPSLHTSLPQSGSAWPYIAPLDADHLASDQTDAPALRAWLEKWKAQLVRDQKHAQDSEGVLSEERRRVMKTTSPLIIPRNWMLTKGYEAAERGDYSVVRQLELLFRDPYTDYVDGDERQQMRQKWIRPSPQWAQGKPGVDFMS